MLVGLLVALAGEFVVTLAGDSFLLRFVDFHRGMVEHFLPSGIEPSAPLTRQALLRQRNLMTNGARLFQILDFFMLVSVVTHNS